MTADVLLPAEAAGRRGRATTGGGAARTVADAATVLRDTTGSVLVRGGGTKIDWAGRVPEPDLVLETTGLAGVLTTIPGT